MGASAQLSEATLIGAALAAGRRAVVSRGWSELDRVDGAEDCLTVEEVNQQALFPRVAAVVHHGGAGTLLGQPRGRSAETAAHCALSPTSAA